MILHCVFCNFRDDVPTEDRFAVMSELKNLCDNFEGATAFDYGTNLDFEQKSQDHSEGFVIRFADQAALELYANDPRHKTLARIIHQPNPISSGREGLAVLTGMA